MSNPEWPEEHRIERYCYGCRQIDSDPMHIYVKDFTQIVYKHFDCCRNDGCLNGACDVILQEAGGARGRDLIEFLKRKYRSEW
jgi:hypothetical protein